MRYYIVSTDNSERKPLFVKAPSPAKAVSKVATIMGLPPYGGWIYTRELIDNHNLEFFAKRKYWVTLKLNFVNAQFNK